MMNWKNSLILIASVVSVCAYATSNVDMMHLLRGGYDAKTMTVAEMDSVLNGEEMCESHRYRLGYKNKEQLFRHSFFADYYLVDTKKNDTIFMSDAPVRDAVMSPNGKYVVYAKSDNNLYIYKVDFMTEVPLTLSRDEVGLMDLETNANTQIFNGVADWLYEEEFGVTGLFAFSPDSKYLAFVRLDEKQVPTFEWQTYLSADSEDMRLYPELHSLRYPKAGEMNAEASVCI